MHIRVLVSLTLLLAAIACRLSNEAPLVTALAATRSADSARATSAAATMQARPTHTSTTTPTASPAPPDIGATLEHLSSVSLLDEDLPSTFRPLPLEEMGTSEEEIRSLVAQEDISIASVFSYLDDTHFQFILGFTVFLPTRLARASFDAEVRRPETMLESLASSFDAEEITDKRILPGADGIGEVSAGMTLGARLSESPFPMRMDAVLFRNGILGAIIFEMYIDAERPRAPIVEVANLLNAKMDEAQH